MEIYNLSEDITITGVQVTGFPEGIGEAFTELQKMFGNKRAYYG